MPLTDENNEDQSVWPQPDRLGRSIRGFKEAHVIFEKNVGVKNVMSELSSNPNKVWFLSTPEHPVVNIGLRKVVYISYWHTLGVVEYFVQYISYTHSCNKVLICKIVEA